MAEWARQLFYKETTKPDDQITLAKACMLIALEEEAAAVVEGLQYRRRGGTGASPVGSTEAQQLKEDDSPR